MRRGVTPRRIAWPALACAAAFAGCGTSPPAADGPQTIELAAPARADSLPPLPRFPEPAYAALLNQVNAEYRRWLADPARYLGAVPEQEAPWPCAVPAAERSRLAGIPDANDPKFATSHIRMERALGLKRGTYKPPVIEGAQVHLRKGGCAQGRLQGEVELLAVYTLVQSGQGQETRSRVRRLTRFAAEAGKPAGTIFVAHLPGPQAHTPGLLLKIKRLEGTFTLSERGAGKAKGPLVEIHYSGTETPSPLVGTQADAMQFVGRGLPLKDDRWVYVNYYGTTKVMEAHYKGDQRHGRTINHAYELKTSSSKEPLRIPASEICFDHDEKIKSATCDID